MEAKAVDAEAIFRAFTACGKDPNTLLLDVRPQKDFKKGHVSQAFNPRLATNGKFLADYSQAQYSMPWSQDCWWGKPVIVYGPPSLAKDHPVIKFLADQQRCASLSFYKQGYDAFAKKYPFLCTTSVKANSYKKYPSLILPGFLYLGDWGDAEQQERLQELKIKRIVTVHNHPERLKPAAGIKHHKIELPDIGSADISSHFNSVYEFLAEAERLKQPTLVHCGAGVSRSACLVIMYLMRSKRWSAQQARAHTIAARSLVSPNDGFWQTLCALEGPLGILDRSDPNDTQGFAGADAPAPKLDAEAAGLPVQVRMLTAKQVRVAQEAAEKAAALAAAAEAAAARAAAEAEQQQQQQQLQREEEEAAAAAAAERSSPPQQDKAGLKRGRSRSRSSSPSSSSSDSGSSSSSSGSDSSSSSDNSSSSESDTSSDSGSRGWQKLRRGKASEEEQQQQKPKLKRGSSKSRSRSRGRDRSRSAERGREQSRDRGGHWGSGPAPQKRSRSRSRSRDRGSPKRRRHSRSRSKSRDKAQRVPDSSRRDVDGRGGGSRADTHQEQRDRAAAVAAAYAGAAEAAAAGFTEPPKQSGWLVKLEVLKPEGMVGQVLLGPMNVHQRVVFGRAPSCPVVLEHLSISRQHAQLTVDLSGSVCIMDLDSQHGTKLNDTWLKSQQQRTMAVGSTVQFGASTRRYKLLEVQKF